MTVTDGDKKLSSEGFTTEKREKHEKEGYCVLLPGMKYECYVCQSVYLSFSFMRVLHP